MVDIIGPEVGRPIRDTAPQLGESSPASLLTVRSTRGPSGTAHVHNGEAESD